MKTKTRPGYVIAFLIAGGVLVWLASLVPSGHKPDVFPMPLDGSSAQVAKRTPAETGLPDQKPPDAGPPSGTASSPRINGRPEAPPEKYFHDLNKAFSWPIEFYGKVIDDEGAPVVGAEAHVSWAISPVRNEPSTGVKMTDATGFFAITDVRGRSLSVVIYKRGFYFPRGQATSFGYAPEEGNFKADRNNPVVYRLQKRGPGVELVTSQYGVNAHLGISSPKDGVPVWVDFFERKTGGRGQMQVCKLTPPRSPDGVPMAKEWRLTLSIPDGGFVELTGDEFPFYPPETGYQPMLDFHYQPTETNWADSIKRQYYVAFGNPRRYGRIEVNATATGGVRLEYAINPDGSRYLEPKEKEQ